jgi:hypothetical protein
MQRASRTERNDIPVESDERQHDSVCQYIEEHRRVGNEDSDQHPCRNTDDCTDHPVFPFGVRRRDIARDDVGRRPHQPLSVVNALLFDERCQLVDSQGSGDNPFKTA